MLVFGLKAALCNFFNLYNIFPKRWRWYIELQTHHILTQSKGEAVNPWTVIDR